MPRLIKLARSTRRSALIVVRQLSSCTETNKIKSVSSKCSSNFLCLDSYRTYIKNFQWNYRKYNIKLPLAELLSAFAKVKFH